MTGVCYVVWLRAQQHRYHTARSKIYSTFLKLIGNS